MANITKDIMNKIDQLEKAQEKVARLVNEIDEYARRYYHYYMVNDFIVDTRMDVCWEFDKQAIIDFIEEL